MRKMKSLAVIPARSGSKGLRDKNIKKLCGLPLMAYTIDAAQKSECFDLIHVSTDSPSYATIAEKYGANVPFLRSEEMSSDTAGSWDVVREVIDKYKELGIEFDTVTLLQPTSPLRKPEDIYEAFLVMDKKKANIVVSVCEMEHSPLWSNILPDDGCMDHFEDPSLSNIPRQQLPVYYRMNGSIYIVKVPFLLLGTDIYGSKCYAYIMPQSRSIDIDSDLDFQYASLMLKEESK